MLPIVLLRLLPEGFKRGKGALVSAGVTQHTILLTRDRLISADRQERTDAIRHKILKAHYIHPLSPPKFYHTGGAGASTTQININ